MKPNLLTAAGVFLTVGGAVTLNHFFGTSYFGYSVLSILVGCVIITTEKS